MASVTVGQADRRRVLGTDFKSVPSKPGRSSEDVVLLNVYEYPGVTLPGPSCAKQKDAGPNFDGLVTTRFSGFFLENNGKELQGTVCPHRDLCDIDNK